MDLPDSPSSLADHKPILLTTGYDENKCCPFVGRSVRNFVKRNNITLGILVVSAGAFAAMLAVGQIKGIRALSISALAPGLIGVSAACYIFKTEKKHRYPEYHLINN